MASIKFWIQWCNAQCAPAPSAHKSHSSCLPSETRRHGNLCRLDVPDLTRLTAEDRHGDWPMKYTTVWDRHWFNNCTRYIPRHGCMHAHSSRHGLKKKKKKKKKSRHTDTYSQTCPCDRLTKATTWKLRTCIFSPFNSRIQMYGVHSWKYDHLRMRIADTGSQPNASIQPGKSDHIRQIAWKTLFRSSNFSSVGTPNEQSSHLQAPLGMVVAPAYMWGLPIADAWCRWLVQGHVYNSILKIFETNLANETTWEIGPFIPSPFGGRNSQVWLYTDNFTRFLKLSTNAHDDTQWCPINMNPNSTLRICRIPKKIKLSRISQFMRVLTSIQWLSLVMGRFWVDHGGRTAWMTTHREQYLSKEEQRKGKRERERG